MATPATWPQVRAIYTTGNQAGMDDDALGAWCIEQYGGTPDDLSRRDAVAALDKVREMVATKAQQP